MIIRIWPKSTYVALLHTKAISWNFKIKTYFKPRENAVLRYWMKTGSWPRLIVALRWKVSYRINFQTKLIFLLRIFNCEFIKKLQTTDRMKFRAYHFELELIEILAAISKNAMGLAVAFKIQRISVRIRIYLHQKNLTFIIS